MTDPTTAEPKYAHIIDAVAARATGPLDYATVGYVTDGGTYVVASSARLNDDGRTHDLVAVLPMPIEGSRVLVLRPTVNPDLIVALRSAFDPAPIENETGRDSRIVLRFHGPEELHAALAYIGDVDAPVEIESGEAVVEEMTFALWDDYRAAMERTEP